MPSTRAKTLLFALYLVNYALATHSQVVLNFRWNAVEYDMVKIFIDHKKEFFRDQKKHELETLTNSGELFDQTFEEEMQAHHDEILKDRLINIREAELTSMDIVMKNFYDLIEDVANETHFDVLIFNFNREYGPGMYEDNFPLEESKDVEVNFKFEVPVFDDMDVTCKVITKIMLSTCVCTRDATFELQLIDSKGDEKGELDSQLEMMTLGTSITYEDVTIRNVNFNLPAESELKLYKALFEHYMDRYFVPESEYDFILASGSAPSLTPSSHHNGVQVLQLNSVKNRPSQVYLSVNAAKLINSFIIKKKVSFARYADTDMTTKRKQSNFLFYKQTVGAKNKLTLANADIEFERTVSFDIDKYEPSTNQLSRPMTRSILHI